MSAAGFPSRLARKSRRRTACVPPSADVHSARNATAGGVRPATRAGITRVILPADNEPNAKADLPPELLGDLKITYVHTLDEVLDIVHHVLVMSVNPGFGAQKFIEGSLRKIEALAQRRHSRGLSFVSRRHLW